MDINNRYITINIGPQNSESWFFFSIALTFIALFAFALPALTKSQAEVEKAKIEAKAK